MKRKLNAVDFFCMGFGAIVGAGWAVSINGWMMRCGGPVPAAIGYLLVLIMMIPIALCYCELVAMFPVTGGGMVFAHKAFNRTVAVISGWAAYGAFIAIIPWEAIQVTDMLGYLFPVLKSGEPLYTCLGSEIYGSTIIIGLVFSVIIYAVNMRGFSVAASAQKILCLVFFAAAVIGAAAAFVGGSAGNLLPVYDTADPRIYGEGLRTVTHSSFWGGCFAIMASAAFFIAGFETIPQGVEEAGGDVKAVGKMTVLSVVMACLFYSLLLLSYGRAWPWKDFVLLERPVAASVFLKLYPGLAGKLLYGLIVVGAIAGSLTPWNAFFAASANMLMSMSRRNFMPEIFSKQNNRGAAVTGQLICFILSCIGPFAGAKLVESITSFSTVAFTLSWTITAWSLVRCRKKYPMAERPYKIPGGIGTGAFAGVLSAGVFVFMFVPASPFYIGGISVKMFLVWMALGGLLFAAGRKNVKI